VFFPHMLKLGQPEPNPLTWRNSSCTDMPRNDHRNSSVDRGLVRHIHSLAADGASDR